MPKLISSSGGDEWFLPDDSHYYFSSMKGPSYVNMLPNAEHTCVGHEMQLIFNIEAFYLSVMKVLYVVWTKWRVFLNVIETSGAFTSNVQNDCFQEKLHPLGLVLYWFTLLRRIPATSVGARYRPCLVFSLFCFIPFYLPHSQDSGNGDEHGTSAQTCFRKTKFQHFFWIACY